MRIRIEMAENDKSKMLYQMLACQFRLDHLKQFQMVI